MWNLKIQISSKLKKQLIIFVCVKQTLSQENKCMNWGSLNLGLLIPSLFPDYDTTYLKF